MSRLAFVTKPYRVHPDSNPQVRTLCPTARVVALDTNLDLSGATIRARELLQAGSESRVFEVTIEALVFQDAMIGGPARYSIFSPADGLNGEVFKAFQAQLDLERGWTVLKVRV